MKLLPGRVPPLDELHWNACADELGELFHVPVRQSDTAIGSRLVDAIRLRRAVNTKRRFREIDSRDQSIVLDTIALGGEVPDAMNRC
jgi:hypothetical protein